MLDEQIYLNYSTPDTLTKVLVYNAQCLTFHLNLNRISENFYDKMNHSHVIHYLFKVQKPYPTSRIFQIFIFLLSNSLSFNDL